MKNVAIEQYKTYRGIHVRNAREAPDMELPRQASYYRMREPSGKYAITIKDHLF
ncbi:MAG: hypothetical protein K2N34_14405 [Lachnospiraceae bacterium]|nr:hypothetical protein [Lachnospiraceae bacterium]